MSRPSNFNIQRRCGQPEYESGGNFVNTTFSDILIISFSEKVEDKMMDALNVQIGQRGVITLPKTLRERYNLQPGDDFTILDLDGVFVLSRRRSEIDALADQITQALTEEGETLESMLTALREERAVYGNQT
jgi:AbrB family looped-hinge helix DNA binding protein